MDKSFPFVLRVGTLAIPNVPENVCIWCTNGYKDITYNKVKIIQSGSCENVLKPKKLPINASTNTTFPIMSWQPKPTKLILENAKMFFENS